MTLALSPDSVTREERLPFASSSMSHLTEIVPDRIQDNPRSQGCHCTPHRRGIQSSQREDLCCIWKHNTWPEQEGMRFRPRRLSLVFRERSSSSSTPSSPNPSI